jgi:hypothetical protein
MRGFLRIFKYVSSKANSYHLIYGPVVLAKKQIIISTYKRKTVKKLNQNKLSLSPQKNDIAGGQPPQTFSTFHL